MTLLQKTPRYLSSIKKPKRKPKREIITIRTELKKILADKEFRGRVKGIIEDHEKLEALKTKDKGKKGKHDEKIQVQGKGEKFSVSSGMAKVLACLLHSMNSENKIDYTYVIGKFTNMTIGKLGYILTKLDSMDMVVSSKEKTQHNRVRKRFHLTDRGKELCKNLADYEVFSDTLKILSQEAKSHVIKDTYCEEGGVWLPI